MAEAATAESVRGERALGDGDVDRLGFGEVAVRIAASIMDRASADGLVIGLDGKWGSGKSSLLHLIERELKALPEMDRPSVISFRPWLVGNRDALLASLFGELAKKVAAVELARGDATAETKRKAAAAAKRVRGFAKALSRTGEIVEVAGEWWGPLKWVGKGLKGLKQLADGEDTADLATRKARLVRDLRDLRHRFVVTIDDVDRLEPIEVMEVLRLVRSVADFPNVVYVLCYDADVLAAAIRRGAQVDDGDGFLEKIVQLTIMTPQPEPFQLRHWFAEDLERIVGAVDDPVGDRLKTIIDQEGGIQLRTPRSVVRTLDSLRFLWPALRRERVDLADLVWLLLIKDGAPGLYRWIETYVASTSATSFGTASVTEGTIEDRQAELLRCAEPGLFKDLMYRHMFSEQLPGIEIDYAADGTLVKIYQKVPAHERQAAIEGRRLASPDHYRLYFSLVGPTHAVSQASFDDFWTAVDAGPEDAAAVLLALNAQAALGSLRKSDVLLERLRTASPEVWKGERMRSLLLAFGRIMDDAWRHDPSEQFFVVSSWDRAERLVPTLLSAISEGERTAVVDELFTHGESIGWLTAILRRETFAHGKYGDQRRHASEWYLTAEQYERAAEIMVARYRSLDLDGLLTAPRPIHVLFAWSQAGDADGPRNLLARSTVSDTDLVRALEGMTSVVNSSDIGMHQVLKRENLERFFEYDAVNARLVAIAAAGAATDIAKRAGVLLQAFENGRRD
jgi:hypothetical protein